MREKERERVSAAVFAVFYVMRAAKRSCVGVPFGVLPCVVFARPRRTFGFSYGCCLRTTEAWLPPAVSPGSPTI